MGYEELLELALMSHDPTRAPHKEQYASLVLTHHDAQLATASIVAARFESRLGCRLATRIEPLRQFYLAEDYHQKYYLRSDRALMAEFREMFGGDEGAFRESTAAARVNGVLAGYGTGALTTDGVDSLGLTDSGRARLAEKIGSPGSGIGCSIG